MPSWSVLTSGWGQRTGRKREGRRGRKQAEGGILDWTAGRKESLERKEGDEWTKRSFMPYTGQAKDGEAGI